jgi:DNA-binding MarR family transcriptional regulator
MAANGATSRRIIPALQRAVHMTAVRLEPALSEFAITLGEANVLARLAAEGAQTVAQLHHAFGHRRSTLTSILDRLEARGYVRREINVRDRRTYNIVPTPSGKRAGKRLLAEVDAIETAALNSVPARDMAAFWRVLDALDRPSQRKNSLTPSSAIRRRRRQ